MLLPAFPSLTVDVAIGGVVVLTLFTVVLRKWHTSGAFPRHLPLPPGPKGLPLVGNLLSMPSTYYWLAYTDWAKQYGDIVHLRICGYDMIILNSAEATMDLFEKRSSIYSSRPRLPMMVELMDFSWAFSLMPYGPQWRRLRKTFHQHFHHGASSKHVSVQIEETRKCLTNILKSPGDTMRHIRQLFSATIFRVTFGIDVKDRDDPYVALAEETMEGATVAGIPGAFLVDMLPILKYVPPWFPGAGFQNFARYYRDIQPRLLSAPVDAAIRMLESGSYRPSMVANYLKELGEPNETASYRDAIRTLEYSAAMAAVAGSDTTVSALQTLILAMFLHPDVQKKAHQELVGVIGSDRLPEFDDMDVKRMPYIHAVVKELLRWQPVAPLGLPHMVEINDEYGGYHIPKGAMVVGNIWSILHDERVYSDPYTFRPERFLTSEGVIDKSVPDPDHAVFGFGRRICPGRHHAYNGAVIMTASLISAFSIGPAINAQSANAKPIENISSSLMTSGLISHPLPFECDIKPRSELISRLLMEKYSSALPEFK